MNTECPVCGYKEKANRNYQTECKILFGERKQSTQVLIKTMYQKIAENIPSDKNVKAMWKFLQKISKVEDSVVVHVINKYMDDGMYLRQLGLAYLGAMILNYGKNKEHIVRSERKRYGSKPPTINLD